MDASLTRRGLLSGALAALAARDVRLRADRRLSVLVVRVDQLRAPALGCYGVDHGQSPRIDRFAAGAMRYEHCFCTEPNCSASRTTFDTGLHTFALPQGDRLDPGDTTIQKLLSAAGYATFHVGKWHKTPDSLINAIFPERVPAAILGGFDYHAGHEWRHRLVNDWYWVDGGYLAHPAGPWRPTKHTDLFLAHLASVPAGAPFYGVLDLEPPHSPYGPITGTVWNTFAPGQIPAPPNVPAGAVAAAEGDLARYYGMIASVDFEFGRVLDGLAAMGLEESTVVVFTSDHGAHVGAHGLLQPDNQKRSLYEEALRIPLLVRSPLARRGGTRGELFGTVDFMPLILSAAGLPAPPWAHARRHLEGLRYCQQLEADQTPQGRAWRGVVRADGMRYARDEQGPWVLFDTAADPYELENLVGTGDPREAELEDALQRAAALVGDRIPW